MNKALLSPWSYAPSAPNQYWTPKKIIKASERLLDTTYPEQQTPMTLAELIDIALKNNTQTQMTWADARSAAAKYAQTQSSALPALIGSFTYERSRFPIGGAGGVVAPVSGVSTGVPVGGGSVPGSSGQIQNAFLSQWGPQLSVAYTIFDFGQNKATSEAARQALYFADWSHNREIQKVINQVTDDYYDYLYQAQLLIALGEDIQTAEVTLDAASVSLESGVKDASDMLQAKTHLLQKQTEHASQQQAVQNGFAELLNAMGLPSNLNFSVEGLPTASPPESLLKDADALLALVLESRPDILAAEANLRSKDEDLKLARRKFFPTIGYNLDFGRTYFSGGLNDGYDFTSAVVLSMPIFSGFELRNGVRLAEANKKQAEAALRQKQLQATKDVSIYHYNVKIAFETLQFAEQTLEAAQEQYDILLSKYRRGTTTIVDVLSAQSSLANARANKADALQQCYTSLANLSYAAGMLNLQKESSS